MTARAYTGPFPCNLTRTMAHVMADEAAAADAGVRRRAGWDSGDSDNRLHANAMAAGSAQLLAALQGAQR